MQIERNQKLGSVSRNTQHEPLKLSKENKTISNENKDVYKFNVNAKELKELFEIAKNSEEVRHDKIQDVKERIEKGEYNVTGRDVVLKIMEEKLRGPRGN
jgi:negative regulator of flagellin synthesis FlgM